MKQDSRRQTIRSVIKRNIGEKIEGVVKVFDPSTLATELREYVVTDKIEEELKKVFDVFTHTSETHRSGGTPRDVMGMWVGLLRLRQVALRQSARLPSSERRAG